MVDFDRPTLLLSEIDPKARYFFVTLEQMKDLMAALEDEGEECLGFETLKEIEDDQSVNVEKFK